MLRPRVGPTARYGTLSGHNPSSGSESPSDPPVHSTGSTVGFLPSRSHPSTSPSPHPLPVLSVKVRRETVELLYLVTDNYQSSTPDGRTPRTPLVLILLSDVHLPSTRPPSLPTSDRTPEAGEGRPGGYTKRGTENTTCTSCVRTLRRQMFFLSRSTKILQKKFPPPTLGS